MFTRRYDITKTEGDYLIYKSDIYTMKPDGSNLVQLTRGSYNNEGPDWSPDKSRIVFASNREFHKWPTIYTMNADGSNIQLLVPGTEWYGYPAWSPDGTKIAYEKGRANLGLGFFVPTDIWIMDPDGSNKWQITTTEKFDADLTAQWFPDNKRVLYLRYENGFFWVKGVDIKTGLAKGTFDIRINLPFSELNVPGLALSPDGKKVLYTNDVGAHERLPRRDIQNRGREIFLYDIDTGIKTRLTSNDVSDHVPCWSPDMQKIVFQRWDSERPIEGSGMFIMGADGSNPQKIPGTTARDYPVKWR